MKIDSVSQVVSPVVGLCGLEVDRIETMNAGKRTVLRVFLDGDGPTGGGPTLDQIAEATRAISNALDASSVCGERPYVLEVSSRGVTRPLTDPRHFRRNIGRLVALSLVDAPDVTGRIEAADDSGVTLDVDGTTKAVAYDVMTRAVLQVELTKGGDAMEDEQE